MNSTFRVGKLTLVMGPLLVAMLGCAGGDQALRPVGDAAEARGQASLLAARAANKATLDALWPNEDGRRWDYGYFLRTCPAEAPMYHADAADVPPAPDLADLAPLLGAKARGQVTGPPPGVCLTMFGSYSLQFTGEITTGSGVTAQNLEETFVLTSGEVLKGADGNGSRRFLSRLAEVRPDLRARLALQGIAADEPKMPSPPRPLFLHGYAWEKTAEHIGTYGDMDTRPAWLFLGSDVAPGSAFRWQLVPSLAPDVYLHGLVVPRGEQRRLKEYAHEIQVIYMVDYGVVNATDEAGNSLGSYRPLDYGGIVYAPGVGPVESIERFGATSDDPKRTFATIFLPLGSVTPGAPLAGSATDR